MLSLLQWLALPQFGLTTIFIVSLVSATLLPMGSEPAVIGLLTLNPELFWPAIVVATMGNTVGGGISWWMGLGAHKAINKVHHKTDTPSVAPDTAEPAPAPDNTTANTPAPTASASETRALQWLRRFGPRACLLSWLPIVGDPLCAVAGWLKLPFWPCLAYMAIGKFARYLVMTSVALYFLPRGVTL